MTSHSNIKIPVSVITDQELIILTEEFKFKSLQEGSDYILTPPDDSFISGQVMKILTKRLTVTNLANNGI